MTLALLGSSAKDVFQVPKDAHGRDPFEHAATEGIEVLNGRARAHLLHHNRIAQLSQKHGLEEVIRWNPRKVSLRSYHYSKSGVLLSRAARNASCIWPGNGSHTSSLCHCRSRGLGKRRGRSKSDSQGTSNSFVGSTVTGSGIIGLVEIGASGMITDRSGED
jgi:hypothetical protein